MGMLSVAIVIAALVAARGQRRKTAVGAGQEARDRKVSLLLSEHTTTVGAVAVVQSDLPPAPVVVGAENV
jgi:hypothetical protein